MVFRELFNRVFDEYLVEKKKPFKANELAAFIRHDLPDLIKEKSSITDQYKIKGSPGAGNWAEIPWIAILDKDITESPEREFYIVYLFDADMSGVHLSLNQGWTQYEKKYGNNQPAARKAIKEKTLQLQSALESSFDFPKTAIDLHAKRNLGIGYELGHICGKFYPADQFPDDVHLIDDLRNLIGVYRELRGKAGLHILDFNPQLEDVSEVIETPFASKVDIQELILQEITPSKKSTHPTNRPRIFDLEKKLQSQRRNKKIGDSAEDFIVKIEMVRLQKENRNDLALKVKRVGQDMSLGFDILSFEIDGTERQIEVKGSISDNINAFFLSPHELEKSKILPNYYLYIVHGVGSDKPVVRIIDKPEFESKLFELITNEYLVKYQPKT